MIRFLEIHGPNCREIQIQESKIPLRLGWHQMYSQTKPGGSQNKLKNEIYNMTHAIMGGAYETFKPSGTIVCYTWDGKKCLPIPTLQIPGQNQHLTYLPLTNFYVYSLTKEIGKTTKFTKHTQTSDAKPSG